MKIAIITEDGKTISRHFGRAPYYKVLTIEEGKIIAREMREKLGHGQFQHGEHGSHEHGGQPHGFDPASHERHTSMAEAVSDCEVVICGGMGRGAYESLKRLNIKPLVTEPQGIDEAAAAYIAGNLADQTELLH